MIEKGQHFKRHCQHCQTGILILLTAFLITFLNIWVAQQKTNHEIAQVILGPSETENPPAFVIANRGDKFIAFCLKKICNHPEAGDFLEFESLATENGLDYRKISAPHARSGEDDNLNVESWLSFLENSLFPAFFEENVGGWFFDTHAAPNRMDIVGDLPDSEAVDLFLEQLYRQLIPRLNQRFSRELPRLGVESFAELFDYVPGDTSLSLKNLFFGRLPEKAEFIYGGYCYSKNAFENLIGEVKTLYAYAACPRAGDDLANGYRLAKRLRGYDREGNIFRRTTLGAYRAGGFKNTADRLLYISDGKNYTFSPAPVSSRYECTAPCEYRGESDRPYIVDLYTTLDTVTSGELTLDDVSVTGNIEKVQAGYIVEPGDEYGHRAHIIGYCHRGPCNGTITIERAFGTGSENPLDTSILNSLNGNTNPGLGEDDFGIGPNTLMAGAEFHDSAIFPLTCPPDPNPISKEAPPPEDPVIIVPPPAFCGDGKINQPGEECESDDDCPYIPGCGAPVFECQQCKCVTVPGTTCKIPGLVE